MSQVYRTLRVAPSDEGVIGVVIDAPLMNLIGPELVRDLVSLLGALESDQEARVMVLASRRSPPTRCDRPSGCSTS
jgi:enoyl-CoA hydratase/carnithine racemase